MRTYCPGCSVWLNGRALVPTTKEVEDYQAHIAKLLETEQAVRVKYTEDTEDTEDEVPSVIVLTPELETEDSLAHALLLDPSMFESDADL